MTLSPLSFAKQPSKQIYFGCEQNYQFETRNNTARCIQEERLSYKPPQSCASLGRIFSNHRLMVDQLGFKDLCVLSIHRLNTTANAPIQPQSKSVMPKCSMGYKLLNQRGKDTCVLKKPEVIKAPSRRIQL